MKITGKVIIEKFNIITEEITSTVEYNDICYINTQLFVTGRNISYLGIAGVTPISSQDPSYLWNIKTSSIRQKQSKINHTIKTETTSIADIGYPTWTDSVGKDTFTVVATLSAPPISTTRTINCLALDYNRAGKFTDSSIPSNGTLTNLTLSTPCIQSDTEILYITYKLYFDNYQLEPLSNMSQGTYEYIRYIFKQSTLYNQQHVPTFTLNDGHISAAIYNPSNCDSYVHQSRVTSYDEHQYFCQLNLNVDNSTKNRYIGAIYNQYTFNSSDANTIGTFVSNFHLHNSNQYPSQITSLAYKNAIRYGQSPIQNIFKHKTTCNVPFQSLLPNDISTMTGSIAISHHSSLENFLLPTNYRVKIVNSGDVGVATYKLEILKLTAGFLGNTFCPKTAILPQDPIDNESYRYHIKAPNEKTLNQYAYNGGIVYRKLNETSSLLACPTDRNKNFFAVYDVITGNKITYDSTNISGFNLTNISDADVISNTIFISCANTGLWKIDLNTLTATHATVLGVDDTKCYAICTHSDGSLWALFEGGLGKSDDLGFTWTIYNTTSTPILSKSGLTDNWGNCVQMVIDPDHVDYRFLFNLKTASPANNKWIWWSTTFAATSPTTSIPLGVANNYELTDSFKCYNNNFYINSEYNSNEVGNAVGLGDLFVVQFGASNLSTNQITVTFGNTTTRDKGLNILPISIANINGILLQKREIDNVSQSAFFIEDSNVPITSTTYSLNSPTIEFFIRYGEAPFNANLISYNANEISLGSSSQYAAYFKDTNFLVSIETLESISDTEKLTCLGCKPIVLEPNDPKYDTYKSGFWKEYGWNGSYWVEGYFSARKTHLWEVYIGGIGISFKNGLTSPSFISTDFFNFIVGNGIMKDNATTLTFGIPYYPRRTSQISIYGDYGDGDIYVPEVSPVSLLDEPVGFSTTTPNEIGEVNKYVQNKGMINFCVTSLIVYSDQLIPSSTSFTFRCKFTSLYASTDGKEIGLSIFSSGTTYNKSLYLRVESNGNVTVRNSANTVVATILAANITIDTEFKFERDGANLISVSYGNNVIYTTTINSQYVIYAKADDSNIDTLGFYDCYLSYTENRPFVRIGDSETLTGSYNSLFTGTTVPTLVPDEYIKLDNIPQVTVHKTAGEVQNTGEVKVATGSGWLIFNNSDTDKSIEGSFTAHYTNAMATSTLIDSITNGNIEYREYDVNFNLELFPGDVIYFGLDYSNRNIIADFDGDQVIIGQFPIILNDNQYYKLIITLDVIGTNNTVIPYTLYFDFSSNGELTNETINPFLQVLPRPSITVNLNKISPITDMEDIEFSWNSDGQYVSIEIIRNGSILYDTLTGLLPIDSVTYSNLPIGNYSFQATAYNEPLIYTSDIAYIEVEQGIIPLPTIIGNVTIINSNTVKVTYNTTNTVFIDAVSNFSQDYYNLIPNGEITYNNLTTETPYTVILTAYNSNNDSASTTLSFTLGKNKMTRGDLGKPLYNTDIIDRY